uniref:Uncharacterized protein n=1 Tax=Orbilia brochopaga TaxID=3140254 RepID=A0A4Y5MV19_9PEZI|nr:hypothetical protein [Drechslerella brochopaga]
MPPITYDYELMAKQTEIYNNSLKYPKDNELIKEKNTILKRNFVINYWVPWIEYNEPDEFFEQTKNHILDHIRKYNVLRSCKIYVESDDKKNLPPVFKALWQYWRAHQFIYNDKDDSRWYTDNYAKNSNLLVSELYDNLLVIGINILTKSYVYTKLIKHSYSFQIENNIELDIIIKEFTKEARQKYYPFFDFYDWNCKLWKLNTGTYDYIKDLGSRTSTFYGDPEPKFQLKEPKYYYWSYIFRWPPEKDWTNEPDTWLSIPKYYYKYWGKDTLFNKDYMEIRNEPYRPETSSDNINYNNKLLGKKLSYWYIKYKIDNLKKF